MHYPKWQAGWAGHPVDAWRLVENRPALLRVGHPTAGGLRTGPGRAAGAALQGVPAQPASVDHISSARFNSIRLAVPRRPRLDAPDTLHHVMVRGLERRAIFRDDTDRVELPAWPAPGDAAPAALAANGPPARRCGA